MKVEHCLLDRIPVELLPTGYTTWPEMSGSGARTGLIPTTTAVHRPEIPKDLQAVLIG